MQNESKLTAAGFMAGLSTGGRLVAPAAPEPAGRPRVLVVDRWNGSRFVEITLHWNGAEYAAPACVNCKAAPARLDSIYCGDACRRAFLTF